MSTDRWAALHEAVRWLELVGTIALILIGAAVALRLSVALIRRTPRAHAGRLMDEMHWQTVQPLMERAVRFVVYFTAFIMILQRLKPWTSRQFSRARGSWAWQWTAARSIWSATSWLGSLSSRRVWSTSAASLPSKRTGVRGTDRHPNDSDPDLQRRSVDESKWTARGVWKQRLAVRPSSVTRVVSTRLQHHGPSHDIGSEPDSQEGVGG